MFKETATRIHSKRRVNIVGTSGSGKSTFGRALAEALDVRYLQMDQLYWKPNWEEPAPDEFAEIVSEALEADEWVLDGNYHSKTCPIKWSRADVVVWLDLSGPRTFIQIFKRSLQRIWGGKEVWPGTGNVETFRRTFLSHESVILWSLTSHRRIRQRYEAAMNDPQWSHLEFVRIRSHKEARALLQEVQNQKRTVPGIVQDSACGRQD